MEIVHSSDTYATLSLISATNYKNMTLKNRSSYFSSKKYCSGGVKLTYDNLHCLLFSLCAIIRIEHMKLVTPKKNGQISRLSFIYFFQNLCH